MKDNSKERKDGMLLWNLQNISGVKTEVFRKEFLGEPNTDDSQRWSNIRKADYLIDDWLKVAKQAVQNKNKWKDKVNGHFKDLPPSIFLNELIDILKKKLQYSLETPAKKEGEELKKIMHLYDDKYKNALIESMQNCIDGREHTFDNTDYVWFMVYLSLFKVLPNEFYKTSRIKHDLDEYNELVQKRYGSTSTPSYRVIIGLAKTGNLVALTELGELHYYGRLSQGRPQYKEAYRYFRIAAGEIDDPSGIHYPLACWDIAYMLFNYGFRRDLKDIVIRELEEIDVNERRLMAVSYCLAALETDCAYVPAYNLLGVILDVLETMNENDEFSKILLSKIKCNEFLQTIFGGKPVTPEDLFGRASAEGYVEACNNLARRECKKALDAPRESSDRKNHMKKVVKYLEKASQSGSTWASNKLGEIYRTGIISVSYEEIGECKSDFFDGLDENKEKKAYCYYLRAIEDFADTASAWASLHLLEYYEDQLDDETRMKCINIIKTVDNKEINERSLQLLDSLKFLYK